MAEEVTIEIEFKRRSFGDLIFRYWGAFFRHYKRFRKNSGFLWSVGAALTFSFYIVTANGREM